jgi:hypothetical protein
LTARIRLAGVRLRRVFLYPGDRHLFADGSLADYDQAAAAMLM